MPVPVRLYVPSRVYRKIHTGEPGRSEDQQQGHSNHALRRAILDTAGLAESPVKYRLDRIDQEEEPAHGDEKDIERRQTAGVVHEGHGEREEDPADHIIAHTSSEDGDANRVAEEVEFREDTAQDRKSGDSQSGTDEKAEDTEVDVVGDLAFKLVVYTPSDGVAQAKGQEKTTQADAEGNAPIGGEQADVDLESDEEEKQDEAEVGDVVEHGKRFGGEDVFFEVRDARQHRRA